MPIGARAESRAFFDVRSIGFQNRPGVAQVSARGSVAAVGDASPSWPTLTPEYAAARRELLASEYEVTRAVSALAAQRRTLPLGGVVGDYQLVEGPRDIDVDLPPHSVTLDDLFGAPDPDDLQRHVRWHASEPCAMCTSLVDGYDGAAADLEQRVGFAVVAPAPWEALRAYRRARSWRNVRLVADPTGAFSRDSGALAPDGALRSLMTVFARRDGEVRHFYTAAKPPSLDGQDDRHLDAVWALWGALDLTPEGREDWRRTAGPVTDTNTGICRRSRDPVAASFHRRLGGGAAGSATSRPLSGLDLVPAL